MTDPESSTWLNPPVGAVATVVLAFTFVSPILGGALAEYLQRADGVRVGAISGVIAALPVLLFALAFVGLVPLWSGGIPAVGIVFVLLIVAIVPAYIVGLSALGGYLGVYLRSEFGADRSRPGD